MKNRWFSGALLFFLCVTSVHSQTITQIGFTTYDLQTNGSIGHRLVNYGNGHLSAVWTFAPDFSLNSPQRGTGYNHFNGTSWLSVPNARLEAVRTGWPSITAVKDGKEEILAHLDSPFDFEKGKNPSVGSAAFTWSTAHASLTLPPNNVASAWGKIAAGGIDSNTIHLVSYYSDTTIQLHGVKSPVVYSRSLDGGATWPIQAIALPGYDSTRILKGAGADTYDIDAAGQNVAIVTAGLGQDVTLWKSVNNGTNFTRIFVDSFPFAPDINVTGVSGDSSETNDNSVSVILDANGMARVAYSKSLIFLADDGLGDTTEYFEPRTIGLVYWDEISQAKIDVPIPLSQLDADGDGVYSVGTNTSSATYARYGSNSLLTHPTIAMDTSGAIYIVFSLPQDGDSTSDGQSFRDIWVVKSTDNGLNWSCPGNITKTPGIEEAFPSVAKLVDTDIHILFQEDFEPGTTAGNNDVEDQQLINYLKINKNLPGIFTPSITGSTSLCAGDSVLLNTPVASSYLWSTAETSQSIYAHSAGWYSVTTTGTCSSGTDSVLISNVPAPIAHITVSGDTSFCYGSGSVTLTADPANVYHWSNGSSTSSITRNTVNQSGIYTVTTYNSCGVSAISSPVTISIFPLPSPPVVSQTPTSFAASFAAGMTYQWLINDTAVPGETGQTFTPSNFAVTNGKQVTVAITDTNGCSSVSVSVTAIKNAGEGAFSFELFPNPAGNILFFRSNEMDFPDIKIEITDMLGRKVCCSGNYFFNAGNPNTEIDISGLDAGMYLFTAKSRSHSVSRKIVIY